MVGRKFLFALMLLICTSAAQSTQSYKQLPLKEYLFGMLHTFAAAYPEVPEEEDAAWMLDMLNNITRFLPKSDLTEAIQRYIKQNEPEVNGRTFLIEYILKMRNTLVEEGTLTLPKGSLEEVSEYWGKNCNECSAK